MEDEPETEVDSLAAAKERVNDALQEYIHELAEDIVLTDWVVVWGGRDTETMGHPSGCEMSDSTPVWTATGLMKRYMDMLELGELRYGEDEE